MYFFLHMFYIFTSARRTHRLFSLKLEEFKIGRVWKSLEEFGRVWKEFGVWKSVVTISAVCS